MKTSQSLLLAIAGLLCVAPVAAQTPTDYPNRPVKVVVPFPAGALTDVATRVIANQLSIEWKQPVVIDNKVGATGILASDSVAKSPGDGYTLLVGTASTHAVLPALKPVLPYDSVKDFVPISLVGGAPYVLAVHRSLPVNTVGELITLLKANPGKYNYASAGPGSFPHLIGEKFKHESGTQMAHIAYRGNAPALNDLIAGQIQVGYVSVADAKLHAKSLKPLAVTSLSKSPELPGVPPLSDTLPRFEAISWLGLFAPAATPPAVVQKIQVSLANALKESGVRQKLQDSGITPEPNTSAEFAAMVKSDTQRWRDVGKAVNIVLD